MTISRDAWRPMIVVALVVLTAWVAANILIGPGGFPTTAVRYATGGLILVAAVTLFALSLWWPGPRPAHFGLREGVAFVVPASRAFTCFVTGEVLLAGFFTDRAVAAWTEPIEGTAIQSAITSSITVGLSILVVLIDCLVALMAVTALRGRPGIELTPSAVVIRDPFGDRAVAWDALGPGRPAIGPFQMLTLDVGQPSRIGVRGLTWRSGQITLAWFRIHPAFLVEALRYYTDQPDQREQIGTSAGHERLLTDVGVPIPVTP